MGDQNELVALRLPRQYLDRHRRDVFVEAALPAFLVSLSLMFEPAVYSVALISVFQKVLTTPTASHFLLSRSQFKARLKMVSPASG